MELTQKSRWAVAVLFFVNGFIQGGWAVQITQLVPRFGVDDRTIFGRCVQEKYPVSSKCSEHKPVDT